MLATILCSTPILSAEQLLQLVAVYAGEGKLDDRTLPRPLRHAVRRYHTGGSLGASPLGKGGSPKGFLQKSRQSEVGVGGEGGPVWGYHPGVSLGASPLGTRGYAGLANLERKSRKKTFGIFNVVKSNVACLSGPARPQRLP